jgi:predicted DNA-binding protein (MmcQ/YjbR family)
MTIEEIQTICEKLNGVTSDIKWGDHLCFNIGGKMFLVTAPDGVPPSASIRVSDEEFENLPQREGIIPAPYMARNKWVKLDNINLFSRKQWEFYIYEAYKIVGSKLPLKIQKQIGISQGADVKPENIRRKSRPLKKVPLKKSRPKRK